MTSLSVASAAPPAFSGPGYVTDLDTPLLMFSDRDIWTLRDAAEGGVLITGGTGSGKSSSSGALLARSYLRAGFGGLVLCVNVDEAERWRRYAAEAGRSQSLIVVDKSLEHRFNFLEYQMAVGRGSASEAVNVLVEILNAAEGKIEETSGKDAFWDNAMRQILSRSIQPLWSAYGRLTLAELMKFVHSRPTTPAEVETKRKGFWGETLEQAFAGGVFPIDAEDFQPTFDYWAVEMTQADQRTPGNIVQTLTARLDPFLSGDLRKLFATYSSFAPDLTGEGAIIVLDLSAHEWGKDGILAQHIVKRMWQKFMERRPKTPEARPCFLWVDEAQYFLAAPDQAFSSTSRACKALTVYLTQNLPGIYARLGANAQNVADALLGNLTTKIFHSQPDPKTAQWAAEMIGKAVIWRGNMSESVNTGVSGGDSTSRSSQGGQSNMTTGTNDGWNAGEGRSWGVTETIDYRLQPSHFTTLRKGGGPERLSEAVVFQAGRQFAHTQSVWTPALFRQA